MIKPMSILNQNLNEKVLVSMRGDREYTGSLSGYDQFMNIVLKGAEEKRSGSVVRTAEMIILRGDNIVYISP